MPGWSISIGTIRNSTPAQGVEAVHLAVREGLDAMKNEPSENIVISMSAAELEGLVQRAMQRALSDAGLYLEDKADREEARKDFWFLRKWRKATDGAAAKIGYSVIGILVAAAGVVIWAGIKAHVLKQ